MDAKKCEDTANLLYLARIGDLEQLVEEYRQQRTEERSPRGLHRLVNRYLESQATATCFNIDAADLCEFCRHFFRIGRIVRNVLGTPSRNLAQDLKGLVEDVLKENIRLAAELQAAT